MNSTMQLLDKAIKQAQAEDPPVSERAFSKRIGLSHAALSVARSRNRLSPIAAGQIAAQIGEDVEHWMALAAIEAQKKSRVTERLRRLIEGARNS